MEIYGDGSVNRDEKKRRKDCRKWKIEFETDEGRKIHRFTGTWTQAQKEKDKFRKELESTPESEETFSERADLWQKRREAGNKQLDDETVNKDRRLLNILKRSKLGNMKIAEIDRSTAVDALNEIKAVNGYGNTYMQAIWIKAKAIFKEAVKDEIIVKSPLQDESIPEKDETNRRALDEAEFYRFMTILNEQPFTGWTIAVRLAVFMGLRRGEILGLRWADVDFKSRKAFVGRQVSEVKTREKKPKGRRTRFVPLAPQMAEILQTWQREQEAYLKEFGVKQTLDTPVVCTDNGTVRNPQSLDRWWRLHRVDYGLDDIVLHELRHTFMTLLGNSQAPIRVIQSIAGWKDISTANVYVHEDETANQIAVDALFATMDTPVITPGDTPEEKTRPGNVS